MIIFSNSKTQSMKRIFVAILALFLVSGNSFAQGEKSLKAASKSLSKFTADFSNTAALEEAKAFIEEAFQDEKVSSSAKSWNTRGDIYFNIADAQMKQKLINPAFVTSDEVAGVQAVHAYLKAFEIADKKGDKKNALKGLRKAEDICNNVGVELYQANKYGNSLKNFKAELKASMVLSENGEESRLDIDNLKTEKYYFAGVTGYYAGEYEDAITLLKQAKETGTSEATLYQLMYEAMNKSGDGEGAFEYLEKGRELFPEDSGLLFSEINYYLGKGELDAMTIKLEQALEQEPTNVSVMLTLGQVHDQIHQQKSSAGNAEEAAGSFETSMKYYDMAIGAEPENFDANYSLGALYYNKAATFTEPLNEAANDLSAAGTKKYDALKEEMQGYFEKALPYFLKCDELNGTDRNTLIALKEIFVRKDMYDKSNEYKVRLESLEE